MDNENKGREERVSKENVLKKFVFEFVKQNKYKYSKIIENSKYN